MIKIDNISLEFRKFKIENINLEINRGEYFILLGPTGAGKTLLLKCIAGLQKYSGKIFINNIDISDIPPEKRNIGLVPQDNMLFPFLSVRENILFGLNFHKNTNRKLSDDLIKLLEIENILERFSKTLSGGEKQRVAVARALAINPDILLLDEPYASLDAGTRHRLWMEMLPLYKKIPKTVIHITHDLEEAYMLGDKIGVIIDGKIEQVGTKDEIFYHPKNTKVARFLEVHNIMTGKVEAVEEKRIKVKCRDYYVFVPHIKDVEEYDTISFCIHPNDIKIIRENSPIREALQDNLFKGKIVRSFSSGMIYTLFFKIQDSKCRCEHYDFEIKVPAYTYLKLNLHDGKEITVSLRKNAIHIFNQDV